MDPLPSQDMGKWKNRAPKLIGRIQAIVLLLSGTPRVGVALLRNVRNSLMCKVLTFRLNVQETVSDNMKWTQGICNHANEQ